MLQAHEDILYLTIAEYTAPLALLKPLYSCDKLVPLQEKFDKLEQFQVFRRPEDVRIKEAHIYFWRSHPFMFDVS